MLNILKGTEMNICLSERTPPSQSQKPFFSFISRILFKVENKEQATKDRSVLVSGSYSQRSAENRDNSMLAVLLIVWLGLGTNTWIMQDEVFGAISCILVLVFDAPTLFC